jgi:cyclophilin family peptidyl-prolyl cis-trans isomerase/HEAT repeat protein
MRYLIFSLSIFFILSSCDHTNQQLLEEIRQLEYLRKVDPEKFITWINSPDATIRKQAVKSLGRIQDTTTISWVANRLIDPDDSVRSEAAFATGQYFSSKAEEILRTSMLQEKNSFIKGRIIEALGKSGTDQSIILLRNFIESGNRFLQQKAAISSGILAYRGFPGHSISQSLGMPLKNLEYSSTSWYFAYGLFRIGSPSEFDALMSGMQHPDPLTRYFSLRAQGVILQYLTSPQAKSYRHSPTMKKLRSSIQSPDYLDKIENLLQDSTWFVRLATLQLLEKLGPASLFNAVKRRYTDMNPHIRSMAIQVIANYQNKAASQFLQEVLERSPDWRERGIALDKIGLLSQKRAMQVIKSSQDSLSWPENYYLIQTLGHIKNSTTTGMLTELAETENLAQLSLVLEFLVDRNGVPTSLFLSKIEKPDPAITTIVASKLAVLKDPKTVPDLLKVYPNFQAPQDSEPMLAILAALENIADTQAVKLLKQESSNPYLPIRQAARSALQKISGEILEPDTSAFSSQTKNDFTIMENLLQPHIRVLTSRGEFELILFPGKARLTVANFLELVKKGFYKDIYFHRVVPGFVIQAGDPRGDGWGGPGYSVPCEYNDIFYDRGIVGMAHAGKDTGGSQFFITHTPQPHLNGRHTAFGKVTRGMEVVDSIVLYDKIIKIEILN